MADQATPAAEAAPVEPAAPAPATPAAPAPTTNPWADAPWASALDGVQDGLTRAQVHELWQGTVQPYVTQKEQELGEIGQIWSQLNDEQQSIPAFLALAERQYGGEVAQVFADALLGHIQGQVGHEGEVEGVQPPGQQPNGWDSPEAYQEWYDAQPPWVQAQEDTRIANDEDAQYQAEVQQYAPDVLAHDELGEIFARYVVATDGDVEQAKQLYDQEFGPILAQAQASPELAQQMGLGFLHAGGQPAAPAAEGAPNVLGATGATGVTAHATEQQYGSMDEVMDDFFAAIQGTGPHLQQ